MKINHTLERFVGARSLTFVWMIQQCQLCQHNFQSVIAIVYKALTSTNPSRGAHSSKQDASRLFHNTSSTCQMSIDSSSPSTIQHHEHDGRSNPYFSISFLDIIITTFTLCHSQNGVKISLFSTSFNPFDALQLLIRICLGGGGGRTRIVACIAMTSSIPWRCWRSFRWWGWFIRCWWCVACWRGKRSPFSGVVFSASAIMTIGSACRSIRTAWFSQLFTKLEEFMCLSIVGR